MTTRVTKLAKNASFTTYASSSEAGDINTVTTAGGTGAVSFNTGTNTYNITNKTDAQTFNGGEGNDTFIIKAKYLAGVTINGGTSTLKAYNGTEGAFTSLTAGEVSASEVTDYVYTGSLVDTGAFSDAKVKVAGRPGATTSFTQSTSILDESATSLRDSINFTVSGDYTTGLSFTNIEKISLASGVQIKLLASQLQANFATMDKGAINPGLQFYGVAGGKAEKVIAYMWSDGVALADDDGDDEPVGIVDPVVGRSYASADLQLDDFTIGSVLHDGVTFVYQAHAGSGLSSESYARIDGSNGSEEAYGTEGSDNVDMRLGNDIFYGYGGNDLIKAQGGADKAYGGSGNDIYVVGGFGSGVPGTTGKSDDGLAEWVTGDVFDGGSGTDTLRVTTGIGATNDDDGTLTLTNTNLKNVERVEVGASVSRDGDESQFQYQADSHVYLNKTGTVSNTATSAGGKTGNSIDNVVIDASAITTKGLTFEGNANIQKFKGTTLADTFIGNGGADALTGNGGADKFVFQTVRSFDRDSGTANGVIAYTSTDTAFTATAADTITDFVSGTDKIVFRVEASTALEDSFDSLVALTKGNLTATNVYIGDAADVNTAGTSAQYIKVDTTGNDVNIYYDADGSGAGTALNIVTLIGVSDISVSDIALASVANFQAKLLISQLFKAKKPCMLCGAFLFGSVKVIMSQLYFSPAFLAS